MSRFARPSLRRAPPTALLAAALCAVSPLLHAQDALLRVQPAQAQALGLRTAAPQPAGSAAPLVLQGQAVLPPQLLRVVSAPVAALIEQVLVAGGDPVAAGRPLLVLNAPQVVEWQREHRQASLQLQLAQQTAERDRALLAEGLIPGARAQASEHQLQIAQAALRERSQLLALAGTRPDAQLSGRLQPAAPAAGTVLEVQVQAGQRVEAGAPLLSFAVRGPLWLELQATPEAAQGLHVGDQVQVAGCAQPARIASIGAQVQDGSQTVTVRARWSVAQDCVLPQQRVQAQVSAPRAGAAWLVPDSALVRLAGRDLVYVQRPGGFQPVPVKVLGTGAGAGQRQVQGTLAATDQVVVQGTVALKGLAQGLAGT